MVYQFKYLKLKEGQLSNVETSRILSKCVYQSVQELNNLKTIAEQQIVFFENHVLCPFLMEFCLYFELYDLNSSLRNLEESIHKGEYTLDKYHTFMRHWASALCNLRSQPCITNYPMPLAS